MFGRQQFKPLSQSGHGMGSSDLIPYSGTFKIGPVEHSAYCEKCSGGSLLEFSTSGYPREEKQGIAPACMQFALFQEFY